MKKVLLFSLIIPLTFAAAWGQSIDSDKSYVSFEVDNFSWGSVDGKFDGMSGNIVFDQNDLAKASFEVCINSASINTDNKKRDDHLKGEDFFEVEKYPSICFTSEKIELSDNGFKTIGMLNMHGISRSEQITFTYSDGAFRGNLTINRLDYTIGPNGGFMVGKSVDISIVCYVK